MNEAPAIGSTINVKTKWVEDDDLFEAISEYIAPDQGDVAYLVGTGERNGAPAIVFVNPHRLDTGLLFSIEAGRALVNRMRQHVSPPELAQNWDEITEGLAHAVDVAAAGGVQ